MDASNLEPLPILVFSNLVMVGFLFLLSRKGLREPYLFRPWRRWLILLVTLMFCLFSFWGTDWFHYAEMYFNILYVNGFNTSLEPVYCFVATISSNYLVFRLIIWGTALFLLMLLFGHVSAPRDLLLAIFCSVWLIYFGYGRVVMAYTLMYLGGAVITKPLRGKVLLSLILGVTLILLSAFFHKSSFFGIALVFLALLPRLLNKRTLLLALMAYPFMILSVQLLLMQFMDSAFDPRDNSSYATAGQIYLSEDASDIGIAYLLLLILEFTPYYMAAWIAYKANSFRRDDAPSETPPEGEEEEEGEGTQPAVPADIRFFSRLLVYIVLVSTIFLFDLGANTLTLYIRFMMFGFLPICVILAWAWQHDFCPRMVKYTYLAGLAGTGYALLYSFYVAYLGVAE
mgnify:FL=1